MKYPWRIIPDLTPVRPYRRKECDEICGGEHRDTAFTSRADLIRGLISCWEWWVNIWNCQKEKNFHTDWRIDRVEKQTLTPIARDRERGEKSITEREGYRRMLKRETQKVGDFTRFSNISGEESREDPDCALNSYFCLRLLRFLIPHLPLISKEGETEETLIFVLLRLTHSLFFLFNS